MTTCACQPGRLCRSCYDKAEYIPRGMWIAILVKGEDGYWADREAEERDAATEEEERARARSRDDAE